jgi:hypothetical protein
MNARMDGRKEG